jgi:hypothetical protein
LRHADAAVPTSASMPTAVRRAVVVATVDATNAHAARAAASSSNTARRSADGASVTGNGRP